MESSHKPILISESRSGWIWLSQAVSGVLLVVLLGLHWVAQHYLASGGMRTFSEVVAYLRHPLVLLLELAFLVVVAYHALIGVRAILLDLGPGKRLARQLTILLLLAGLAAVLYGVLLVIEILAL